MPGERRPDAVIIGAGATGLVVAHELVSRGFGVVVLEAGDWHHPQRDFTGDEAQMLHPVDGVLRWGPIDGAKEPWRRHLDGISVAPQIAGVGGLDLVGWGARPRAYVASVDSSWPFRYDELIPWYERIEELLPVAVPRQLMPKDQAFVDACESLRLGHIEGADVERIGWRLQPSAILPMARRPETQGTFTFPAVDGCTGCGGCLAGCRNPEGAPIARTAMRNASAALAAPTWATGKMDLRTGCFATELIHEERDGVRRVRAVLYRDSDGSLIEQDGETFILCLGAVETPRLVLSSALGAPGRTGRGLTCHWMDVVSGVLPNSIEPSLGPVSMARLDLPGHGSIFPLGLSPLISALVATHGDPRSAAGGPWARSGALVGGALKRHLEEWPARLSLGISVGDRARVGNGVQLDPRDRDEHGAWPSIRYEPDDDDVRRRDWLARRAGEILIAAGAAPESIHRADLLPTLIHAHGTMRMGRDPANSVTDPVGRLHGASNAYVADASVLPTSLGGADPALTAQALAARTAGAVALVLAEGLRG